MKIVRRILFVTVSVFLNGCGVGYNYTLFMTKSNFGVDIDSKPPTAEVSLARREVVIEPTFEGGQTLPVFAAFKARNSVATSFLFGVDSMFAGGAAAAVLTDGTLKESNACKDKGGAGILCLSLEPKGETLWEMIPYPVNPFNESGMTIPSAGKMKPFVFATDTTFGLKVAWSGTAGQFPDSIKVGFNRKEFAFAPIFGKQEKDGAFLVGMPPFLAGVDQSVMVGWTAPFTHDVDHVQFFATGAAAVNLAQDKKITDRKDDMLKLQVQNSKPESGAQADKPKAEEAKK